MHTALVSRILRDKTLWEEVTHSEREEAPYLQGDMQTAARSSA
jgi:hypothetical protein